mgnify:CR=1 FL=1
MSLARQEATSMLVWTDTGERSVAIGQESDHVISIDATGLFDQSEAASRPIKIHYVRAGAVERFRE